MITTASAAPFVGLLGTVIGILTSFLHLSMAESATLKAVGGDIADALARDSRVYLGHLEWPAEEGALRLCPHIFNSHDEIERLLQGLQRELGKK
jgi:selenocysteine lyase/cysteine desulfurase